MSAPTSPPPDASPRRPARARPRPQRLAAVLATGAVLCSALVALSPGTPASAVSPTGAGAAAAAEIPTGTVTFVNAGSGKCLATTGTSAVGAALVQRPCDGSPAQSFRPTATP
ncbi:ferric-dicitrate binding protein FerR (iron transport regulator) [Streptomyces sp. PvR006]|uniref:RICIN domain-containing protein n=1 Tax=Streptomyces sp. PvR006 TaxID=2817860 RepID=UPI001AE96F28|nr:RICIN domain-containing protein [Streptomyces sp. PvR006]MBP2580435.1 ferric-dicitrate binding protein FerR (iron transport regulator) [Streptomyces sp. PvR006]